MPAKNATRWLVREHRVPGCGWWGRLHFRDMKNPRLVYPSHITVKLRALKDVRLHERLYSRRVGFLTGRDECAYIYPGVTKIEWCLPILESRHENEQA